MSEKIRKALDYHFQNHRLIFWYDEGGEMRDDFIEFNELGIEKIEINNDEFNIRYKVQKIDPEQKFLIYSTHSKPEDKQNWLMDLNLSGFVFASDKSSLILQELDLDINYLSLIKKHSDFFKNKKERLIPFKNILNSPTEDEDSLLLAMISILASITKEDKLNRREFPEIALNIFLNSFLDEDGSFWEATEKYHLEPVFWELAAKEWSYTNNSNMEGLLNYLLQNALDFQLKHMTGKNQRNIFILIDEWRNNLKYSERFKELLDKREKELNIKHILNKEKSLEVLISVDLYKEADKQVLVRLIEGLKNRSIDYITALHLIEKRRETFWFKSGGNSKLRYHYLILYYFLQFKELRKRVDLSFTKIKEGWDQYIDGIYKLDELYRKFHYAFQESGSPGELVEYLEDLEKEYTEGYMIPLSDNWQKAIDSDPYLESLKDRDMKNFFKRYVVPYLNQDKYLFVIISDGMRYEIGAELAEKLEGQNRFKVELETLKAPTPSYTQLGMASLLPPMELSLASNGNTILADGKSTQGWPAREKILQSYLDKEYIGKKAKILNARDFFESTLSDQEESIKGIDLIYLFSPGVDAVGENTKTEKSLFSAVEKEIDFLNNLSRRILNLNRTHILLTADHGFLYRYKPVPEVDWMKIEQGDGEVKRDHRYIVAEKPLAKIGTEILEPEKLSWNGPFRVQVASGIGRIRRPGGGSLFVHGGRMLHELIVPLLILKKSRTDDVSYIEISVIDRKNVITTGQISVKFMQEEQVDRKTKPREIAVLFESADRKELSNTKILIFDDKDPNNQNRTRVESFLFNKHADDYNEEMIYLRLYDLKAGNTKVFYKEFSYRLRKNIQSDFDF